MSIRPEFFDYLRHFGKTVTMRELHERPEGSNVVTLRHDIDHDLDLALEVAHHEHRLGLRATYFLLHTHAYWDDERFALKCRQLEAYGHEVALHVNVLTEWVRASNVDVAQCLLAAIARLREAGVDVVGVSAHGDRACYEHGFANYWIWHDVRGDAPERTEAGRTAEGVRTDDPKWQVPYPAGHELVHPDGTRLPLWNLRFADFGLAYDAAHVPCDHYWTDSGGAWKRSGDPRAAPLARGRHQILMHPHWWRGRSRRVFLVSTGAADPSVTAQRIDQTTAARSRADALLDAAGGADAADPRAWLCEQMVARSRVQRGLDALGKHAPDVVDVSQRVAPFLPLVQMLDDEAEVVALDSETAPSALATWVRRAATRRVDEVSLQEPVAFMRTMAALDLVVHPLLVEAVWAANPDVPQTPAAALNAPDAPAASERIELDVRRITGHGVEVERLRDGVAMRTSAAGVGTAHALLDHGAWRKLDCGGGIACADADCFTCVLTGAVRAGAPVVRLFALSYDDGGNLMHRDHLATIDDAAADETGEAVIRCCFAAARGASRIALALHFGDQTPEHEITLHDLVVETAPGILLGVRVAEDCDTDS